MRYFNYILILLLLAIFQLLSGWTFHYVPEFIFILAFVTSLHVKSRYCLINFFIAGVIYDLFLAVALGVNTFAFVLCAVGVLIYKLTIHNDSTLLKLLLMGLLLVVVFAFRVIVTSAMISGDEFWFLWNNLLFSLLITPAAAWFLEIPIICPWKKLNA